MAIYQGETQQCRCFAGRNLTRRGWCHGGHWHCVAMLRTVLGVGNGCYSSGLVWMLQQCPSRSQNTPAHAGVSLSLFSHSLCLELFRLFHSYFLETLFLGLGPFFPAALSAVTRSTHLIAPSPHCASSTKTAPGAAGLQAFAGVNTTAATAVLEKKRERSNQCVRIID